MTRFDQLRRDDEGLATDEVLESIHGLCKAYARALPPGAGCRVSEEQFRLEVECVASGGTDCAVSFDSPASDASRRR